VLCPGARIPAPPFWKSCFSRRSASFRTPAPTGAAGDAPGTARGCAGPKAEHAALPANASAERWPLRAHPASTSPGSCFCCCRTRGLEPGAIPLDSEFGGSRLSRAAGDSDKVSFQRKLKRCISITQQCSF